MVAFIRQATLHWRSATPGIDADAAIRVVRQVFDAWGRWRGVAGDIAVVAAIWKLFGA